MGVLVRAAGCHGFARVGGTCLQWVLTTVVGAVDAVDAVCDARPFVSNAWSLLAGLSKHGERNAQLRIIVGT